MRGDEVETAPADLDLDADKAAPLAFTPVGESHVVDGEDGEAREQGPAVLPALIVEVVREGVVHPRQTRQLPYLVHAPRPLHAAVNLLQTDYVCARTFYDLRDARKVELLVHADADVNVVGHHVQPHAAAGWRGRH